MRSAYTWGAGVNDTPAEASIRITSVLEARGGGHQGGLGWDVGWWRKSSLGRRCRDRERERGDWGESRVT